MMNSIVVFELVLTGIALVAAGLTYRRWPIAAAWLLMATAAAAGAVRYGGLGPEWGTVFHVTLSRMFAVIGLPFVSLALLKAPMRVSNRKELAVGAALFIVGLMALSAPALLQQIYATLIAVGIYLQMLWSLVRSDASKRPFERMSQAIAAAAFSLMLLGQIVGQGWTETLRLNLHHVSLAVWIVAITALVRFGQNARGRQVS